MIEMKTREYILSGYDIDATQYTCYIVVQNAGNDILHARQESLWNPFRICTTEPRPGGRGAGQQLRAQAPVRLFAGCVIAILEALASSASHCFRNTASPLKPDHGF